MTTPKLPLPEGLELCRREIEASLGLPVPGEWPDDESILKAEQPAALAAAIIPLLHKHLQDARIACLFVQDKREKQKVRLGSAAKTSSKVRFLADVDYVVEFNWTAWRNLTAEQRVALVDHELCHCAGRDEKGKWVERAHDVEEFTAIVGRWGLWKDDVRQFANVVARQLEILD
jgi:predicted metallopeptidase